MITKTQFFALIVAVILSVVVIVFLDQLGQLNIFMATVIRIVVAGTMIWCIVQFCKDWWRSKREKTTTSI